MSDAITFGHRSIAAASFINISIQGTGKLTGELRNANASYIEWLWVISG